MLNHSKRILRAVVGVIGFAGALASIAAYLNWSPADRIDNLEMSGCDIAAQPLAESFAASLAASDCNIQSLRICEMEETSKSAEETSHGMPAHLIRLSFEFDAQRVPIMGNGRGAFAREQAVDNALNNLKEVLEEKEICS